MKLFRRHFYSSLTPVKHLPPKELQILQLCRAGSLSVALRVLNSVHYSEVSIKPNLYASLLQTCNKVRSFNHGLQIHCHVIKTGLEFDRYVGNSLLTLYFKLSASILEIRRVFDGLIMKDAISWSSMIAGYVQWGKPQDSLGLYREMLGSGIETNEFTLSAVVKASSELGDLKVGRCFHGVVLSCGFNMNNVIACALIDMYGRTYEVQDARQLFDELLEPDAISWTSVISACTRNDMFKDALGLFYLMQINCGFSPDGFMFGTVLAACGNLRRLKQGKELHGKIITTGMCGNVIVESSLVDMYGKCGSVFEAQCVFDRMSTKNSVSWSALLDGYCQNGNFSSTIKLFRIMDKSDFYSFGTALRACAGLASLRQGKEIHCQYIRRFGWRDIIVESSLVDLYSKCGYVDYAYRIFIKMVVRNLITWNSMICGFAHNGRPEETLKIFDEMAEDGIKPDYITFVGLLFACSHTGLVHQGREYFVSMAEHYKIKAGMEHYNCMVVLLGRAGLLEEAENLIAKSDFKNESSLWAALLGACTSCTSSDAAERIAKRMMELEPSYHLSYVLLANRYKAVGRWSDAVAIGRLMRDKAIIKMPGRSWIEVGGNVGFTC